MPRKRKQPNVEPSGHICYWAGCSKPGNYKAPSLTGGPRDYQWFCEEHIAQFNKNWNFFDGMNEAEIYQFQKESYLGAREENWRLNHGAAQAYDQIDRAFGRLFGKHEDASLQTSMLPGEMRDALSVMNLEHPAEKDTIKQQYRDLVKQYHPDVNAGNDHASEMFKKVSEAYRYLIEHYCKD